MDSPSATRIRGWARTRLAMKDLEPRGHRSRRRRRARPVSGYARPPGRVPRRTRRRARRDRGSGREPLPSTPRPRFPGTVRDLSVACLRHATPPSRRPPRPRRSRPGRAGCSTTEAALRENEDLALGSSAQGRREPGDLAADDDEVAGLLVTCAVSGTLMLVLASESITSWLSLPLHPPFPRTSHWQSLLSRFAPVYSTCSCGNVRVSRSEACGRSPADARPRRDARSLDPATPGDQGRPARGRPPGAAGHLERARSHPNAGSSRPHTSASFR